MTAPIVGDETDKAITFKIDGKQRTLLVDGRGLIPGLREETSHWLTRAWKHHELSRVKRGITDGSQLSHDDHAFIELWHAVRELSELAKKAGG